MIGAIIYYVSLLQEVQKVNLLLNEIKKGNENESEKKGFDYLLLSLTAFGGLGIEMLYAYLIEPMIYGKQMQEWNQIQSIIHWTVTCITWGLVAIYLHRTSKKDYDLIYSKRWTL